MSRFFLAVQAGVAKVYPYGQGSQVAKTLTEGEAVLCSVPVGDHVEPHVSPEPDVKTSLQNLAAEDQAAPAAGVDTDSPPGNRTGTVLVAVLDGSVTLRTYSGAMFSESALGAGEYASVDVTESNRITLAVYDAAPKVKPSK